MASATRRRHAAYVTYVATYAAYSATVTTAGGASATSTTTDAVVATVTATGAAVAAAVAKKIRPTEANTLLEQMVREEAGRLTD